jgi:ribosomal protein S18 acetylase RimI-like enzyme
LDYGVFNIALLDGPTAILEAPLAEFAHYYMPRTTRWSFWLCEDLLDSATLRRSRALLLERGLYPISHAPGMLAPALPPPSRRLPEIECVAVSDQSLRQAFGSLTAVSFDIPMGVARAVYYPERAWNGAYRGFVGMVKGRPVAIVAIVESADSLGIYSLATMPDDRHRGYGEALLRAAIASEQKRTGIHQLVLQSTEAGYSLYRRLGFRDVTKFSVYLTK